MLLPEIPKKWQYAKNTTNNSGHFDPKNGDKDSQFILLFTKRQESKAEGRWVMSPAPVFWDNIPWGTESNAEHPLDSSMQSFLRPTVFLALTHAYNSA